MYNVRTFNMQVTRLKLTQIMMILIYCEVELIKHCIGLNIGLCKHLASTLHINIFSVS